MFSYELHFIRALIFTILIETTSLFLLVRYFYHIERQKISNNFLVFCGIFTSSLTLPYLWFIVPVFINSSTSLLLIGEPLVCIVESLIYYYFLKFEIKKSVVLSLVCNSISLMLGLVLSI